MPNTSKPRAKAATAARGKEKKAPTTKKKRTSTVADRVMSSTKLRVIAEKATCKQQKILAVRLPLSYFDQRIPDD